MATPQLVRSFRLEDGTVVEKFDTETTALQALAASIVVDGTVTASHDNVFKTPEEAAASRRLLTGPAIVEFRNTVPFANAPIDFRDALGDWNTTFVGVPNGAPGAIALTFPALCTLRGVIRWKLIAPTTNATPFMAPPDGTLVELDGAVVSPAAGVFARALNATASGVDVALFNGARFAAGAGICADASGAGSLLVVVAHDLATIDPGTLAQPAGTSIFVITTAAASVSSTQAGVVGGVLLDGTNEFPGAGVGQVKGPAGFLPAVQAGHSTLAAGTHTVAGVTIRATSEIVVSRKDASGAALNNILQAPAAGRTNGNLGAGSFVVEAWDNIAGAVDATDTSTFTWAVFN